MKFIKRNWAINNAMPVFFIGFFLSITNDDGILNFLGFGIMVFSFYLWYLASKQDKKKQPKLIKKWSSHPLIFFLKLVPLKTI